MQNVSRIEEILLSRLRELTPEKQQEVLDFVEFLKSKETPVGPRRSPKGLWADLNIDITSEDIAAARREMWGGSPRETAR